MTRKYTIKQLRVLNGFSQEEVTKKVGISREHLSKMEKNSWFLRSTSINTALALAKIYEVGIEEIVFLKTDITQNGILFNNVLYHYKRKVKRID